jgi:uncharacterized cupredoxin-like copper-binding protein
VRRCGVRAAAVQDRPTQYRLADRQPSGEAVPKRLGGVVIRKSKVGPARAALLSALFALLAGGAGGAFVIGAPAAAAKTKTTTVNVVVGDTAGLNGPMTMTVTPDTAPKGKVKFVVQNQGTIIHEMVVIKITSTTSFDQLPVTNDKVSERKSVGEVSSIGKGKTKSKTLKLKAGTYALVCNIAKHYGLGMRAGFTVT